MNTYNFELSKYINDSKDIYRVKKKNIKSCS